MYGKPRTHVNLSNKTNREDNIKTKSRVLNGEDINMYDVSTINKDNEKESTTTVIANKTTSENGNACDNIQWN